VQVFFSKAKQAYTVRKVGKINGYGKYKYSKANQYHNTPLVARGDEEA
jgi:hypothetical protein